MRPKQCITVSATGTHNVCVCTYHQNVMLMATSSKTNKDYKEFIRMIVCDTGRQQCMMNECTDCPGKKAIHNYLTQYCRDMSISNLTNQQWPASGKCSLQTLSSSADEFIENFSEQVHKLKKHSFTAKAQASFLKNQKATQGNDEIIILLAFAENFLIQPNAYPVKILEKGCPTWPGNRGCTAF